MPHWNPTPRMASDHARTPHRLDDVDAAADALLARIDGPLRIGTPLGLG